jgi:cell division GTPase FtsZ
MTTNERTDVVEPEDRQSDDATERADSDAESGPESRYTSWGVVAAGGGGGRIASQFLIGDPTPGIGDRIVVMNTHPTDIRRTIEQLSDRVPDIEERFREHAFVFGSRDGAGNKFQHGRECVVEDADEIVRRLSDGIATANALLYVSTLGGGTGNGTVPYLVRQLNGEFSDEQYRGWMDGLNHVTLAVWPFAAESEHRQYNAVCGLSRLLLTPDREQNADMVLLASNEHLGSDGGQDRDVVNSKLPDAVELMIAAGRRADEVVDVEDYVSQPSDINCFHFSFGLAKEKSPSIGPRWLFEQAAESTYVPMDVETCRAVFGVIRAPREDVESRKLTGAAATNALNEWKREHGISATGDATVIPAETDTRDALLLLGGFDLDRLLSGSMEAFQSYKSQLAGNQLLGGSDEKNTTLDEIERLEENLEVYRRINSSTSDLGEGES